MLSPKEYIEQIRRNEFGIGLETDADARMVIQKQNERLHRALKNLSDDLYDKDTHFVLELIQNAEDNDYDDGVEPYIRFIIDEDKITIENNEKGFSAENVSAICDVGKTTKKKAKGYIGEKGIGFKSVFKISNAPHIFSNGFQFKFKHEDKNDILGFVVPYWVEELPESINKNITTIVLPLRDEFRGELSKFDEIDVTLILFLKKLRGLSFENRFNNVVNFYRREPLDDKIKIESRNGVQYWKVIDHPIDVPNYIDEEKRTGVEEREIVLAFPLKHDGTAETAKKQKIFAYLPTERDYGFRFIIHADFLVTTNRGDIHKDKQWNEWLRDNIAPTFIKAVNEFKSDNALKTTFYGYIPRRTEVTDLFFKTVVEGIYELLQEEECVFTQSGCWAKPKDTLIATDEQIIRLVSNQELKQFLGKEYVSDQIKTTGILEAIGVRKFNIDDLIVCLKNTEWVNSKEDEWFIQIYSYLNFLKENLTEKQKEELKTTKIVRLENNELIAADETTIFFPPNRRIKDEYGLSQTNLKIVKRELVYIIPHPRTEQDQAKNDMVRGSREFLSDIIGVQPADPYEIIENYIIPLYESGDWTDCKNKDLTGLIKYIKDNIDEYERKSSEKVGKISPLKRLMNSLYIRSHITKDGESIHCKPDTLYLPKIYGTSVDLEKMLVGIDGVWFVHSCYIEDIIAQKQVETKELELIDQDKKQSTEQHQDKEIEEWRKFFVKLGVLEKPNKEHITEPLKNILKHKSPEKASTLLQFVHDNWETYRKFLQDADWHADGRYSDGGYDKYYDTEFKKLLIGTYDGWYSSSPIFPTTERKFVKPSEAFLDKPEIRLILDDSVAYHAISITNEDFIRTLGISTKATVDAVLNQIKMLAEDKVEDERFVFLYLFLDRLSSGDSNEIKEFFRINRVIYVPKAGYFNSREVIWQDLRNVFGSNRAYLEKHYPDLKRFFIDIIGVSEKPTIKDYADVLIDLSKKISVTKADETTILKIYEELENYLKQHKLFIRGGIPDWWQDFLKERIFWTNKNEFWKNDDNIFVIDDNKLYDLYRDAPQLAFLKLSKDYHPDKLRLLLTVSNIKKISKEIDVQPYFSKQPTYEQQKTGSLVLIQRPILAYLWERHNAQYEQLKRNDKMSDFRNIQLYSVGKLGVKYILKGIEQTSNNPVLLHENRIYVQRNQLDDQDFLGIEIAKFFGDIQGLDQYIINLLNRKPEGIEEFLRKQSISLPNEEWEWFSKLFHPSTEKKEESPDESPPPQEESDKENNDSPHGEGKKRSTDSDGGERKRSANSGWKKEEPYDELLKIEKRNIERIIEYERSKGRDARDVSRENLGYDIESIDKQNGETRYIEVKSSNYVMLTNHEYEVAQDLGSPYYLYVVEPNDSEGKLYIIKNPASTCRIDETIEIRWKIVDWREHVVPE